MTDDIESGYQIYTPTLAQRFWRALGFRYHHKDLECDEVAFPGWMKTRVNFDFSMLDRLRLLLTGRLRIDLEQRPNVMVDECRNAASYRICYPFETDA